MSDLMCIFRNSGRFMIRRQIDFGYQSDFIRDRGVAQCTVLKDLRNDWLPELLATWCWTQRSDSNGFSTPFSEESTMKR